MANFFVLLQDHLINSLRTKKALIFLCLYLGVFGLIAYGLFQAQNFINKELDAQGISESQREAVLNFSRRAVNQLDFGQQEELINFLINIPFLNIMLFAVTIFGTPFLILILNYDKISQEIYDGTLRYLLFRTSRLEIFLAKFLSGVIETAVITFTALFLALLWGSTQIEKFDFVKSFFHGVRFWFIAQVFLAIFVAFSLLFSSLFKKPFHALLTSFIGFCVMGLIPLFAELHTLPSEARFLSPFENFYMQGMLFDFSPQLYQSLGFFGLFTAIFLGIGYAIFYRKDL